MYQFGMTYWNSKNSIISKESHNFYFFASVKQGESNWKGKLEQYTNQSSNPYSIKQNKNFNTWATRWKANAKTRLLPFNKINNPQIKESINYISPYKIGKWKPINLITQKGKIKFTSDPCKFVSLRINPHGLNH